MITLRYGNTNTFYLPGAKGGLLIDTDWAGTLPQFFKAIKAAGLGISDISHVLATHYHPDHVGIIGELQRLGLVLLAADVQRGFLHFPDEIFSRDRRLHYVPIDETAAKIIPIAESRAFLHSLGIGGEILHTPSHSEDSISVLLDDGDCIVGDLEPYAYLNGYEENPGLKKDWDQLLSRHPRRIFYAHANTQEMEENSNRQRRLEANVHV